MKRILSVMTGLVVALASLSASQVAAAGSASLSFSPSSGSYQIGSNITLTVKESSSDSVNVVEANYSFDSSKLQFVGASCSSAFEIAAVTSASGVTCGTTSPKTGSQSVATLTFKALSGSGMANINFASSSHVYRSTDNTNIWNGSTSGASFSLTTPAQPSNSGSNSSSSSSSSSNNSSSSSNSSSSNSSTNSNSTNTSTNSDAGTTPAPTVPAKTYTAVINVTDNRGNSLGGAKVTIRDKTQITNSQGQVSFPGLVAGGYDVHVTYRNGSQSSQINIKSKNKTTQQFLVKVYSRKTNIGMIFRHGSSLLFLMLFSGSLVMTRKRVSKRKAATAKANKKAGKKTNAKTLLNKALIIKKKPVAAKKTSATAKKKTTTKKTAKKTKSK